jgi:hypothetical protein
VFPGSSSPPLLRSQCCSSCFRSSRIPSVVSGASGCLDARKPAERLRWALTPVKLHGPRPSAERSCGSRCVLSGLKGRGARSNSFASQRQKRKGHSGRPATEAGRYLGSSGFCVAAIQFPPLCKGRLGGVEASRGWASREVLGSCKPASFLPPHPLLTKEGTPLGTTHVLSRTHTISGRATNGG